MALFSLVFFFLRLVSGEDACESAAWAAALFLISEETRCAAPLPRGRPAPRGVWGRRQHMGSLCEGKELGPELRMLGRVRGECVRSCIEVRLPAFLPARLPACMPAARAHAPSDECA